MAVVPIQLPSTPEDWKASPRVTVITMASAEKDDADAGDDISASASTVEIKSQFDWTVQPRSV